jgi:hypothetical protein
MRSVCGSWHIRLAKQKKPSECDESGRRVFANHLLNHITDTLRAGYEQLIQAVGTMAIKVDSIANANRLAAPREKQC